jgi:hypothetical protein
MVVFQVSVKWFGSPDTTNMCRYTYNKCANKIWLPNMDLINKWQCLCLHLRRNRYLAPDKISRLGVWTARLGVFFV